MKKIIFTQFYVLLLGTLFAWGNFGYELYNFINQKPCELGCSINTSGGLTNPFLTPCFYGALFFAVAFIFNIFIIKSYKKLGIN